MISLSLAFLASLVVTLLLVRFQHWHAHLSADHDLEGVQKFHSIPVPRIGGVGILIGILIGLTARWWQGDRGALEGLALLACASPVFLAGLIEDLTKRVGVRERLLAAAFAALLAGHFLGAWVNRLDLPGVDLLLKDAGITLGWNAFAVTGLISVTLTGFAVSGVANAFNLIDGYNGLTGVVAIIILLGLAYVAEGVHDLAIVIAALTMVGGVAGFLIWNYPNGLIFLGDGGAYLIGFWIAELSVLLVVRNPSVSPWFPLLLSFYPIFETLFTIFRRVVLNRSHPGLPDAAHLHQLVYRRLVRWAVGSTHVKHHVQRNAITAPYLWLLSSLAVIPAVLFWRSTGWLLCFILLFSALYTLLYRSIVRRKHPKWWVVRRRCSEG